MEAGRGLLSSPPPFPTRTHLKNGVSSSSSAPGVSSVPVTSTARHFPTSVLLQELRDEYKPLLHIIKEDKSSQRTANERQIESDAFFYDEDKNSNNLDDLLLDFGKQLLHWPDLMNSLPSSQTEKTQVLSLPVRSLTEKDVNVKPCDAVALAKKALSASKQAALLAEDPTLHQPDPDDTLATSSSDCLLKNGITVRSKRLLERRSKNRKASKLKVIENEAYSFKRSDSYQKVNVRKKSGLSSDSDDALRSFLWGPETKKLLTAQEESELIVHIQEVMRLEKVKEKLQSQFSRQLTLSEWAEAVGMGSQALKSVLQLGDSSREKLICANLRMVVHIAKQYLGRGLCLSDLLQEGSLGLMKSVEKFKPQAGCRFATYAYWWIRHTTRKAVFQHSRTIRLPENVYSLLGKVSEANKWYVGEGDHCPSKEKIASRVGISIDKLEKLLQATQNPVSLQQTIWADQDTTYQEVTADSGIEIPDTSVSKQIMRQHLNNLLTSLSPRERRIIRLRYGMEDGNQKSLSEIGDVYGLSKERVRQLENRALYRLKQNINSHGLGAYADLLV